MTGKELIYKAFRHESVPRAPWVPFAGVHAGKLKGYDATEVLTDGDKLFDSLMEVHRLYMPDGQPIVFDLQLEAEILGCELMWAENNPPSVTSHPLDDDSLPTALLDKTMGRLPLVFDVARRMKEAVGDETALYGLFCGPFTLVSHLRGTKLFADMKKKPEHVRSLLRFAVDNAKRMIDYYDECGMDIIAPVDPLVSQISPKNFTDYMTEPYTEIFEYIRSKGKFSSFFVCGNALRNIEEMCKTNPDGISIDENIPMETAKAISDQYNLTMGGNIPLTTIMLFGNQQDNMKFVVDMIDKVGLTNLIVAPGCDMPYDIPIENAIAVAQTVRELDKYRELVKNYETADLSVEIEMPDYEALKKPLIEAFTLDSASCAACQYMWAMVQDAKEKYGEAIDIVEYKYTELTSIARCKKVGVQNLPSLYMNGKLAYASIIPSHDEFYAAIEALMK